MELNESLIKKIQGLIANESAPSIHKFLKQFKEIIEILFIYDDYKTAEYLVLLINYDIEFANPLTTVSFFDQVKKFFFLFRNNPALNEWDFSLIFKDKEITKENIENAEKKLNLMVQLLHLKPNISNFPFNKEASSIIHNIKNTFNYLEYKEILKIITDICIELWFFFNNILLYLDKLNVYLLKNKN